MTLNNMKLIKQFDLKEYIFKDKIFLNIPYEFWKIDTSPSNIPASVFLNLNYNFNT